MSWTAVDKLFSQMLNKFVNGFKVKSGVLVCDRGASGIITNDSKTFGLKNLKVTIVRRRCIAPDGGSVGEYRTDQ